MEEAVSQGKALNKEQEDVLRSKPSVCASIDELEKLRQPLSVALTEEHNLVIQRHLSPSPSTPPLSDVSTADDKSRASEDKEKTDAEKDDPDFVFSVVEDLLRLLYFGSLFDVKTQSDFTSLMFTRTHERGCCLTYDYVTDDATDPLGESDLDMISSVGSLLISRPVNSSLSHKNALQRCLERARLWLSSSDEPIDSDSTLTYRGLRERLNKIMSSDYFITTPEMKAPVEVAAAGNYAPFQVPAPAQMEGSVAQYQQKDVDTNFQGQEVVAGSEEELPKDELANENSTEEVSGDQQEQVRPESEAQQNQRDDAESKEQQNVSRRNQKGGRGGGGYRRVFSNGGGRGRGGRGGGSGSYSNGRNQFHEQGGGYYYAPRRGRGGNRGGGSGGYAYNSNHHQGGGSGGVEGGAGGDIGLAS